MIKTIIAIKMKKALEKFLKKSKKPEMLEFSELKEYIKAKRSFYHKRRVLYGSMLRRNVFCKVKFTGELQVYEVFRLYFPALYGGLY